MIPIPAIDLKNGKCVRLRQGKMAHETVYGEDPLQMAKRWEREGAERLHIVDLDGAVQGHPVHLEVIQRIAEAVAIPIEVGGGIRTLSEMEVYLSSGVHTLILGTAAFQDPAFLKEATRRFPQRLAIALDTKDNAIAVKGWLSVLEEGIDSWIERLNILPLFAVIHTDVRRDGTQRGLNTGALRLVLRKSVHPLIASGGVGSLKDLETLKAVEEEEQKSFFGVIIGRALYEGNFTLQEATRLLKGHVC